MQYSTTTFDITQAGSSNVLQVATGKIYRDGAYLTVAAKNFTSGSFQATANTHHLLEEWEKLGILEILIFLI